MRNVIILLLLLVMSGCIVLVPNSVRQMVSADYAVIKSHNEAALRGETTPGQDRQLLIEEERHWKLLDELFWGKEITDDGNKQ